MLILLVAGLILTYLIQQKIYEKCWENQLKVEVEFENTSIFEGEHSALKETISNDKKLPLPALEVRIGVSKNLEFSGAALDNSSVSDQSYRRDVFSLFSYQKVIRTLPFTAVKRGYYQIERSEVVGSDFFFQREYNMEVLQNAELYVYPGQVDTGRIMYICRSITGLMIQKNRLYPDPFEFSGIRDYQKTDPMHYINWKASVRSGKMMVNQFDSTTNVDLIILLDTQDDRILKYDELTEEGIRIASSLAGAMQKRNLDLYVKGNGICSDKSEKKELGMYLKAGAGKLSELNRRLASIDTSILGRCIGDLLEEEKNGRDQIYCLISRNEEQISDEAIDRLIQNGNSVLWIIPSLTGSETHCAKRSDITRIVWEVER